MALRVIWTCKKVSSTKLLFDKAVKFYVVLIQIDASSFVELEISEFEISRPDCISMLGVSLGWFDPDPNTLQKLINILAEIYHNVHYRYHSKGVKNAVANKLRMPCKHSFPLTMWSLTGNNGAPEVYTTVHFI